MKGYMQVPAAVELVGERNARVRTSLQIEGYGPQRPPVEQPKLRCGRSAAMVKRRTWVNMAVCPCLHLSLTNINPFEHKVWDIYIFIKKWVHSFLEVRHYLCLYYRWLCFRVYVCGYTTISTFLDYFMPKETL